MYVSKLSEVNLQNVQTFVKKLETYGEIDEKL